MENWENIDSDFYNSASLSDEKIKRIESWNNQVEHERLEGSHHIHKEEFTVKNSKDEAGRHERELSRINKRVTNIENNLASCIAAYNDIMKDNSYLLERIIYLNNIVKKLELKVKEESKDEQNKGLMIQLD